MPFRQDLQGALKTSDDRLIEADHLVKHFAAGAQTLGGRGRVVRAVDDVSFSIGSRRTLCLVGETGSGKTTVGLMVAGLIAPTSGRLLYRGQDIGGMKSGRLREIRRKVQVVFQDPTAALNPRKKIGQIVGLPLQTFDRLGKNERNERVEALLDMVGLTPGSTFVNRYPGELSGGQRQRVAIARAIAPSPELIVADEPTSALDASVRAQILNLLQDLRRRIGLSYLLIQHDLATAVYFSDSVAVMYLGKMVEIALSIELLNSPQHPYTQALFTSSLLLSEKVHERVKAVGDMPSPINPPPACRFHTRCPFADARCKTETPELREISSGHWVACHHPSAERNR